MFDLKLSLSSYVHLKWELHAAMRAGTIWSDVYQPFNLPPPKKKKKNI